MRLQLCLCVLPLAAPFVLQPVTRPRVTTRRTPRAALLVPATETGAGLLAATGVLAWVAPEANLPGFKDYDSTAAAVVRTIGAWQIVLAVALLASAAEPAVAAGRTMYAAAIGERLAYLKADPRRWAKTSQGKRQMAGGGPMVAR